jgi:hypothetical protein
VLHRDYQKYVENQKVERDFVKRFFEDHNIKANIYLLMDDVIAIEPTAEDKEEHGAYLANCKYAYNLKQFNKRSRIGKNYVERKEKEGLKLIRKPNLILYMRTGGGRFRTRLFEQNGLLYCSIEADDLREIPDGFTEIKGSEFMKILEDAV